MNKIQELTLKTELEERKLNIAIVTDTYRPQVNGVVSSIDTIKEELKGDHNIHIYAPTEAEEAQSFRSFPFYLHPDYRIAYVRAKTLAKHFQKDKIEIVHVQTPFSLGVSGVGAARHLQLPAIGTFHTLLPEYTHYISETLGLLLERFGWRYVSWFYGRFNAVTVPSSPIKDKLVEEGLEDVFVIPNAVNLGKFQTSDDNPKGPPTILFVGRLGKEKRLNILMDAAPRIISEFPDIEFKIIGTGPDEKWYKTIVEKKNLTENFTFEGYVSESDLIKAYQSCDLFAMPSDTETQGLVTLEAMGCGKPVVGANARGLTDVITHGRDGYLFSPGDSDELSKYILDLLEDESLREKMSSMARKKAERFSSEVIGRKWVKFYSAFL